MKVDIYERFFAGLAGAALVVFFAAMAVSAFGSSVVLTDPAQRIKDPSQLASTPPFNEPGVRQLAPGRYEVVMIASAWQYTPNEVRVPAGSEVTFIMTSADVVHGMELTEIPFNVMLIPGEVTKGTVRFREAGEHLMICHEYCGTGHQTMFARVIVEDAAAEGGQ